MHSIAFRLVAEEVERGQVSTRVARRQLRDIMNPLELPESLFLKFYRVNKDAFKYLLEVLTNAVVPVKKQFAIPPIVKLSGSLRFFAEGGYQTGVGKDSDVGLAQSSFSKVLSEVLDIFENHLCPEWIKVCDTAEEKRKIAMQFYIKHGIPGVVGCIDGTHVRIIAPAQNAHLFYNSKGYYRLNVLLLCDHELTIRYVDASHPGACHDSFIWKSSDLRDYFEQEYKGGENSFWLLGDAGYPLEPWLMTPHRSPQEGSTEMRFNKAHAKCRNIIERTNGVVKNRWRCILGARELHYSPEKAAKIINVCCALHNLCLHFKAYTATDGYEVLEPVDMDPVAITPSQYYTVAQAIRANIGNNL